MSWLAEYGLFLAKSLTTIFSLVILLTFIILLTAKKKNETGTVSLENISKKMKADKDEILHKMLTSKSDKKAFNKANKKSKNKKTLSCENEKRLFVIEFDGDVRASQVVGLKACVNMLLQIARPNDEVLIKLESPGGMVHTYGLAASHLQRIRDHNLNLTVSIDKVAASGGYLMASIAHRIISAPFAIIGSIGVIGQLPNFNRLLNKHHIDFEQHTAGKFKRTLTVFGENTDEAREKFQEDLEQVHVLFKNHVSLFRPQLELDKVATGEYWYGHDAKKLNLVDEIQVSDDFINALNNSYTIYELRYHEKKKLKEKMGMLANSFINFFSQFSARF